jgi:hypothetical protein
MATPQSEEQAHAGKAGSNVLSRHPAGIALGGGVAAAFGSSFIPMNAIEGFVTAYGIAELLPAAAPPLGDTARIALSAGIGTLTAGALLALLPRGETDDMGFETAIRKADDAGKDAAEGVAPAAKSGRLAGWLRTLRFGKSEPAPGTITDFADLAPPVRIRNGDQHPDAPVRAPIRASSDLQAPDATAESADAAPLELGEEMTFSPAPAPAESAVEPEPVFAPSLRFAPPPVAAPESEDEPAEQDLPAWEAEHDVPETSEQAEEPVWQPAAPSPVLAPAVAEASWVSADGAIAVDAATADDDLDSLSVGELLERLEAGLARRRAQASASLAIAGQQTEARIVPLAAASAVTAEQDSVPQRFRQRLGDAPLPVATVQEAEESLPDADALIEPEQALPSFRSQPLWAEEDNYLPPAISAGSGFAQADEAAAPSPAELEPEAAEQSAATPQDDDMDAALRDALATLRQLSERQRGG